MNEQLSVMMDEILIRMESSQDGTRIMACEYYKRVYGLMVQLQAELEIARIMEAKEIAGNI